MSLTLGMIHTEARVEKLTPSARSRRRRTDAEDDDELEDELEVERMERRGRLLKECIVELAVECEFVSVVGEDASRAISRDDLLEDSGICMAC